MSDVVPEAAAAAAPVSRVELLAAAVEKRFAGRICAEHSRPGELTYRVAATDLLEIGKALRDEEPFKFEVCIDVCGVDYLLYGCDEWKTSGATSTGFSRGRARLHPAEAETAPSTPRFAVVYHLLSVSLNQRLRLRVFCPDDAQPIVDSVTGLWESANWFEREAFDLFGIMFRGHRDLRRILTDYGFIGHPFRKDFPLSGNVEVRYDPEKGRVVYQPVSIEPRVLVPRVIRHDNRYEEALKDAKRDG